MGYGDEIIASGMAKGAKARGKRIAFGDGNKIDWHPFAHQIFWGNPNVAPPGSERDPDIEWIANYRGSRPYNRNANNTHWEYVPGMVKTPGEIFFKPEETEWAARQALRLNKRFVLIEPSVPHFKRMGINKQWPVKYYRTLAKVLRESGYEPIQFVYQPPFGPSQDLPETTHFNTPSFRHSLALMKLAQFYVGPEGGMHHGAAAVGTPAVVIFGGYISPDITGYPHHYNHFTGGKACGKFEPCEHCATALASITVDQVFESCTQLMKGVQADGSQLHSRPGHD